MKDTRKYQKLDFLLWLLEGDSKSESFPDSCDKMFNFAALKSMFTVTESRKATTGSELFLDSGGAAVLIDRCPSEGRCSQSVSSVTVGVTKLDHSSMFVLLVHFRGFYLIFDVGSIVTYRVSPRSLLFICVARLQLMVNKITVWLIWQPNLTLRLQIAVSITYIQSIISPGISLKNCIILTSVQHI